MCMCTRHCTKLDRHLAASRAPFVGQVNEYKYEIERLTRELQDVKRRYYEQKRREQLLNAPEQPKGAPLPGARAAHPCAVPCSGILRSGVSSARSSGGHGAVRAKWEY